MFNLESEKMTAWYPDDRLTFTFDQTFWNNIANWANFVIEIIWFDDWFEKNPKWLLCDQWAIDS